MIYLPLTLTFAALLASLAIEDIGQLENLAPGFGTSPPPIGRNIDGGSVFTNFFQAYRDGQFFWKQKTLRLYEKPGSEAITWDGVMWCSDLTFSDVDVPALGFTGRCLWGLANNAEQVAEQMAEGNAEVNSIVLLPDAFVVDLSISGVFVPQLNSFDINFHGNVDNYVFRLRDDGRPSAPYFSWEVHDEGSLDPNQAVSSGSTIGTYQWINANATAALLNMDAADLTPSSFPQAYKDLWIKNHRDEAAEKNPETEAELVIVEEVEKTESSAGVPDKPSLPPGIESISDLENMVPGFGTTAPAIGRNIEGGSVFTNFLQAYNDGQFFVLHEATTHYEKPGTEAIELDILMWCSDLTFSNFVDQSITTVPFGFTGQCVWSTSIDRSIFEDSGAQLVTASATPNEFNRDVSISGVYVPQMNAFDISWHRNTDNFVFRFYDDGRSTAQFIGWEVHDEGDRDPNAGSSSFSSFGSAHWIPANETAALMNMDVANLTPANFLQVYKNLWIENHEIEAETNNPEPEAELAIVEEVEETKSEVHSRPSSLPNIENASDLENLAPGFGSPAPFASRNIDGGSVFINFYQAYNDKQFFLWSSVLNDYEKPGSKLVEHGQLVWCGDLTFSDFEGGDNIPIGFAGRCLGWASISKPTLIESGAQIPYDMFAKEYFLDLSISGVFIPQLNGFDICWHLNTDNLVYRMLDDGRATSQTLKWEVHDEGDVDPNAGSSSFSGLGRVQWISANEAATLMSMDVTDLDLTNFLQMYENVWIQNHEKEAIEQNPETEAELDIIEEVKGERDGEELTEDTTSPGAGKKLGSIIYKVLFVTLLYFGGALM